jgi:glycosyltransferase involved in cell wall biosynthesis
MASNPPRVLMVVEKLHGLGGAQKQALRLVRALRAHGIESRIVTGRWRWSEPRRAEMDGVPVTAVFTAFKLFHLKGLRKLGMYIYAASLFVHLWLHRRSYDIIHVHSATVSAFPVAIAGRRLKKPTVMKMMASGGWSDLKRMRERGEVPGSAFMARRFRGIDRVICLNSEAEAECREEGFSDAQRVMIPNGFPVGDVTPKASYAARERVVVTYAGRLDAQKNPGALLDAVSILAESRARDFAVQFLGDGPQRAELERRARELRLADIVTFTGRVDDVPSRLLDTDIFVLPSLSEGISNALLEAMAYGLPCIATRIPGNVELVRDRETGILVEPNDARGIASALRELASDPGLRERLGRAARRLVEQQFDIDAIAKRYAALYGALLSREAAAVAPTRV